VDTTSGEPVDGIGLSEAIHLIREDLLVARREGEDQDIRFPVESVTVELRVVASKEAGATAGFKVPFVHLEVGGSMGRSAESSSIVTVVFGAPVDRRGEHIKVAEASDIRKG
jgi:hypothetical protein